ncbi:uncharacterized protein V6R79_012124 [Siganus canaliculatus]
MAVERCGGTLWWNMAVERCGGTLRWNTAMERRGRTRQWNAAVERSGRKEAVRKRVTLTEREAPGLKGRQSSGRFHV